jgi:23S rRNA (cytidine1920-2'-O)/16S rRNA (cytidine1409-2'-O)-methyltransferase
MNFFTSSMKVSSAALLSKIYLHFSFAEGYDRSLSKLNSSLQRSGSRIFFPAIADFRLCSGHILVPVETPNTIDSMKVRIDKLLVERGLVPSRERAQAMVLSGRVLVNEQKVEKAGASVDPEAAIRLLGDDLKYVGRGGLKLEAALRDWNIDLTGRTCMDVGASTGGFTDCMLQHGAAEVIAVDTGYGQIHARLRSDPRVKLLEKTNARYLTQQGIKRAAGANAAVTFIAIDVSFISVTLVLPAVLDATLGAASSRREVVILIKPQFEVGRERVGKGGIVKDEAAQQDAVQKVRQKVEELGGKNIELMESPILGMEGNREFLLHTDF